MPLIEIHGILYKKYILCGFKIRILNTHTIHTVWKSLIIHQGMYLIN